MGNDQSHHHTQLTGVLPGADSATVRARGTTPKSLARARDESPALIHTPPLATTARDALRAPALADDSDNVRSPNPRRGDASDSVMHIEPPAHALLVHDPVASVSDTAQCEPPATTRTAADATDFAIPESVRKSQTLAAFADVCSEIVPQFLYVSNVRVARDVEALAALGITHIIDCCKELTCASAGATPTGIERLQLALRDDVNEDLSWFFYPSVEFIERARESSSCSRVLVHCHQGVSRSCALVTAYLMFDQQRQQQPSSRVSFRDALAIVKAKRPIASPNTAFLCQLIEWERELTGFTAAAPPDNALYRLAPHAAHDAATLVLKCCYEPSATLRKRVVVPLHSGLCRDVCQRLYSRGVFVFLQQRSPPPSAAGAAGTAEHQSAWRVVIWQGRECAIPDDVAAAKALVQQMLRVRCAAHRPSASMAAWARGDAVDIVEIREHEHDAAGTLVDHYGYAAELDWLVNGGNYASVDGSMYPSPQPTSSSSSVNSGALASEARLPSDGGDDKPQLFVFEELDSGGSWDHLTDYDADNLTPSDAFLLLQPSRAQYYLWIGTDCTVDAAVLRQCAASHTGASNDVEIVQSGHESDLFWTVFERGY